MNESYLCRLFKQETGKNIFHYLNELRIEKSLQLITNPDLSIKEVASLVGIENQYYFNRLFKKHLGQSPSKYKKAKV